MWQRDTSGECSNEDEDSATITDTSYDIPDLEEDSSYSITVRASNTAGSSEDSDGVNAITLEAGERDTCIATDIGHVLLKCLSIQLHLLPHLLWPHPVIHHPASLSSGGWCHVSIVMER